MDHIVYLDYLSKELENLLNSNKDIILRGATGRKLPYGRASIGDTLFLCNNNGEKLIKASCVIKKITFTEKLTKEQSETMVDELQDRIKLHSKALKRFRGKRYLSIVEVKNIKSITPFPFNKEDFSTMDDWLLVEDINKVKL